MEAYGVVAGAELVAHFEVVVAAVAVVCVGDFDNLGGFDDFVQCQNRPTMKRVRRRKLMNPL